MSNLPSNVYKGWVTTVIGIITFISALVYVFQSDSPDYMIFVILLVAGISFLFFPDTILTNIKTYLSRKAKSD